MIRDTLHRTACVWLGVVLVHATSCSAPQRAAAVKVAAEIADVVCAIAPLGGAVAGGLVPAAVAPYVDLTEKGVSVACGAWDALHARSSGGGL
jgi:hypothetical protein